MQHWAEAFLWNQLKQEKSGLKKLPPIFPLVISQCERSWKTSLAFEDLLDIPDGEVRGFLKPYTAKFEYLLIDLSKYDERRLVGNIFSHLTFSFMKAARQGGILAAWSQLKGFLREIRYPDYLGLLDAWMRYTLEITEKEASREQVFKIFKENLSPQVGGKIMTLAEELREEGEVRGIAKGIAKGEAKGRLQTLQETLIKMIYKRFGEDQQLIKGVQTSQDIALLEDLIDTFLESPDKDILKVKLSR